MPNTFGHSRMRLAVAGVVLSILLLTLAGAWAEARWPNAAGAYITVTPTQPMDTTSAVWQLRHVDGVQDAIAVFQGSLEADEIKDTAWAQVWFYTNQTDDEALTFLPPDPTLRLYRGRLPGGQSLDEAVLGYELAQALRLEVGDVLTIRGSAFQVVGIWGPSARQPGNFAQVSVVAAEAMVSASALQPHHFVVLPMAGHDATQVAARIWRTLPDMEVLSPAWELAQARHEHTVLGLALCGTVLLALLLCLPLLADLAQATIAPLRVALPSGAGGLVAGWMAAALLNRYTGRVMALTPLRVTPRLATAVLVVSVGMGLLATRRTLRSSWTLRYAMPMLALALAGAGLVVWGTLSESLNLSLAEAQRAATDWVTIRAYPADDELLHAVRLLPGIRGYVIEAYGGLVNEDEARWLGARPSSGVVYGLQFSGGEGTLSVPYQVGYARGRAFYPGSLDEAVVGYDLAQEHSLAVGDVIEIRGVAFTVVGIREHLSYDPHNDLNWRVDISLEALQRVLRNPFASGEVTLWIPPARSQPDKLFFLQEMGRRLPGGIVFTLADRLAEIASGYPATWALTQADPQGMIRHARVVYTNAVALCGVFLLMAEVLAVAGMLTRQLASDERQVALRKAFGADEGMLLGEYLQKATLLGIASGLLGVLAGWAISATLNWLAPSGCVELLFTPRLGAGAFFFIVLMAMLVTVVPASQAVRRDATRVLLEVGN